MYTKTYACFDLTIITFGKKKTYMDMYVCECAMMNFYVLNQRQQNSKLTGGGGVFLSRTNINRDQVIRV